MMNLINDIQASNQVPITCYYGTYHNFDDTNGLQQQFEGSISSDGSQHGQQQDMQHQSPFFGLPGNDREYSYFEIENGYETMFHLHFQSENNASKY